jgi:hypothetical protein
MAVEDARAALQLPFELRPRATNALPSHRTKNVEFLDSGMKKAPWTGYFATWCGVLVAVESYKGVWFEIRRRDNTWEAHCLARPSLSLTDSLKTGMDYAALRASEEPVPTPEGKKKAREEPERDEPMPPPFPTFSTSTMRALRGAPDPEDDPDNGEDIPDTIDDPVSFIRALRKQDGGGRLDGIPPAKFKGDRAQTMPFLREFRRFMRINRKASIAKDPWMKAAYFLSLVEGREIQGWLDRNSDWLDEVEADPSLLPRGMTIWEVVEGDFKRSFIDYVENERAHDELRQLKMEKGNVDDFIATFQMLAQRAGVNPNDPSTLRLFARGLPSKLCDACIDYESPESFEQWVNAARRQHRNWLCKKTIRGDEISGRPAQNNNRPGFIWRVNNPRNNNAQPLRPRLPPRDDNRMQVDTIRKATTDAEKEQHRKEGRCFKCSQQGHLARNCPKRPPRPPRARAVTEDKKGEEDKTSEPPGDDLTARKAAKAILSLNENQRAAFIRAMVDGGQDFSLA